MLKQTKTNTNMYSAPLGASFGLTITQLRADCHSARSWLNALDRLPSQLFSAFRPTIQTYLYIMVWMDWTIMHIEKFAFVCSLLLFCLAVSRSFHWPLYI